VDVKRESTAADAPQFNSRAGTTAANFRIESVLAGKGYRTADSLELVAGLGGTAYIPFKAAGTEGKPAFSTRGSQLTRCFRQTGWWPPPGA
jgi:hypothetical protein